MLFLQCGAVVQATDEIELCFQASFEAHAVAARTHESGPSQVRRTADSKVRAHWQFGMNSSGGIASRAAWGMAEQFAMPVTLFATIPVLLHSLGVADFGLFGLVLAVGSLGALLSVGVPSLTARNVSMHNASGDTANAIAAVRSAVGVVTLVGGSVFVIAALSIPTITEHVLVRMGPSDVTSAALLSGFACALLQEIDSIFSMALKGRERFRLAAAVEWAGRLVWATSILVAATVWGLTATLVAAVGAAAVKAVAKAAAAMFAFRAPSVALPSFDPKRMSRLVLTSRWLWFQNLSGLLALSADRLIVGAVFGAAVMGAYTACAQLAQFAHLVPVTSGQALLPWATRHISAGTEPTRGWKVTLAGLGALCLVPGAALALLSAPLLSLWLGPEFAAQSWPSLFALSVSGAVLAFFVPHHYVLLAAGQVRWIGWANVCGAAASIAAYYASAPWGITAFAAARASYALPLLSYLLVRFPGRAQRRHPRTPPE